MDCENWYSAQGTVETGVLVKELKVSRIRIELDPRKAVEESFLISSYWIFSDTKCQQLRPTEALLALSLSLVLTLLWEERDSGSSLITPFSLDSFLLTHRMSLQSVLSLIGLNCLLQKQTCT